MRKLDLYISNEAPNVRNGAWIKPLDGGGYGLYIFGGGAWNPLTPVDDGGTTSDIDDVKQDLVGKSNDKKTANTINGAKNYAKDQADTLKGTADDTAADLTLYGLKAYIDSKVPSAES